MTSGTRGSIAATLRKPCHKDENTKKISNSLRRCCWHEGFLRKLGERAIFLNGLSAKTVWRSPLLGDPSGARNGCTGL